MSKGTENTEHQRLRVEASSEITNTRVTGITGEEIENRDR